MPALVSLATPHTPFQQQLRQLCAAQTRRARLEHFDARDGSLRLRGQRGEQQVGILRRIRRRLLSRGLVRATAACRGRAMSQRAADDQGESYAEKALRGLRRHPQLRP